ncbi:MAG TPA: hypothetical protein VJB87_01140 [Candidatus Nanoarchaeia archaeon]|nr:hypothetical protein [Candidatus Nanoarchaeia archaeon]
MLIDITTDWKKALAGTKEFIKAQQQDPVALAKALPYIRRYEADNLRDVTEAYEFLGATTHAVARLEISGEQFITRIRSCEKERARLEYASPFTLQGRNVYTHEKLVIMPSIRVHPRRLINHERFSVLDCILEDEFTQLPASIIRRLGKTSEPDKEKFVTKVLAATPTQHFHIYLRVVPQKAIMTANGNTLYTRQRRCHIEHLDEGDEEREPSFTTPAPLPAETPQPEPVLV